MNFSEGFSWRRELGQSSLGQWLPFEALTAIHWVHRSFAGVVLLALLALAYALWRVEGQPARRWSKGLLLIALWQLVTGLSNVVLGWPIVAALAHTGGAAALCVLISLILTRSRLNPLCRPLLAPVHSEVSASPITSS